MSELIILIKDFLVLQKALVSLVLKEYADCTDVKFLIDFPKRGGIFIENVEWQFIKHGAGFLFINTVSGVEIDARREVSMMHAFDLNRIEQYLESLGMDVEDLDDKFEREIRAGSIEYEDVE